MSWDIIFWCQENSVDFVPSIWKSTSKDDQYKCPYGLSETKRRALVYDCADINQNFVWCQAKIKKQGITSLSKAKAMCEKGKYFSNFEDTEPEEHDEPEPEGKRRRKPPQKYIEDNSDDNVDDDAAAFSKRIKLCKPLLELNKKFILPKPKSYAGTSEESQSVPEINTENNRIREENTDFEAKVLFELREIKAKLELLDNRLLQRGIVNVSVESDANNFVTRFPANTVVELEDLNQTMSDGDNITTLVNMFYLLGGQDVQKTVYFIMNKIFDKNLALEYSGQGKKQKKPFSEIKFIYNAVFTATRKRHSSATDESIKKYIGLYLATARSRAPRK